MRMESLFIVMLLLSTAVAFAITVSVENYGTYAVISVANGTANSIDIGLVANGTVKSVEKQPQFNGIESHAISGGKLAISVVSSKGISGPVAKVVFDGRGSIESGTAMAYNGEEELPVDMRITATSKPAGPNTTLLIGIAAVAVLAGIAFAATKMKGKKRKK